jgi:hypothetical protein
MIACGQWRYSSTTLSFDTRWKWKISFKPLRQGALGTNWVGEQMGFIVGLHDVGAENILCLPGRTQWLSRQGRAVPTEGPNNTEYVACSVSRSNRELFACSAYLFIRDFPAFIPCSFLFKVYLIPWMLSTHFCFHPVSSITNDEYFSLLLTSSKELTS